MTKSRWRVILPVVQVVVAFVLFVYGEHEYHSAVRNAGGGGSIEFFVNHFPGPAARVSDAINFPALAVVSLFNYSKYSDIPIFRFALDHGEVWVTIADLLFFALVGVLWWWVGIKIDRAPYGDTDKAQPFPKRALLRALVGICIAVFIGVIAVIKLLTASPPTKQISPFGILWSIILLLYFTNWLTPLFRKKTPLTSL